LRRGTTVLAALSLAHCAASTRPERDANTMDTRRDANSDASLDTIDANDDEPSSVFDASALMDAPPSLPDALDDLRLFADGAECRMGLIGEIDCQQVFARRVMYTGLDRFVCCAGRCFQGLSCFVEDPTRARCDLAEAPCSDDQLCCEIRGAAGRANCVPRSSPVRCTQYVDRDANP
jgi:hypothetical protein